VTLISKADPLSDLGKRLIGSTHQDLCPFQSPSHDVALGSNSDRLLEGAAEMIRAETGNSGEISQSQSVIQMGFDVVSYPLQTLLRQPAWRLKHERRVIDKTPHYLHSKRRVQRVSKDPVDEPTIDFVGDRSSYLRNQRIAERILWLEGNNPAVHQFGGQVVVGLPTLQNLNKSAAGQITP